AMESVDLIVPTIDDELELFARARARFEQRGIRVAVSPAETTAICDDKQRTCDHLLAHGIAAARTCRPADVPANVACALFAKPRSGRGGGGAHTAKSPREREFCASHVPDAVVQEYLEGPEFTIDVLCGFDGALLSVVPRERVVIRAGVIDRGRTSAD